MLRRIAVFGFYGVVVLAVGGLLAYLSLSFVIDRAPEVAVPAVAGLGLSEALDKLQASKLDLEVRGFQYSDEVAENRVLHQRPGAGAVIKAGRAVGVVLSRGSERHPTPAVVGLNLEDARILLEEAGLKAEASASLPGGPEGYVLGQGVEAGTRLLKGKVVPLLVSSGPRPMLLRMPKLEGLPREKALLDLDAAGLRPGRVEEVAPADPAQRGLIAGQQPLAGHPVARGAAVDLKVGADAPVKEESGRGGPDARPADTTSTGARP